MTRVVFLGTPEAATPALQAVAQYHEVSLVITQPDRPKGRSNKPVATPVKELAERLGLGVRQPDSTEALREAMKRSAPFDLGVVVAYGRILPPDVLEIPGHGLLNVHFSLLPRWRGAAPVERAIMAGDTMTGITIMKLDEGLDTGPVLTAQAIDIGPDETGGELTARLAAVGAQLLVRSIGPYLEGVSTPVEQTGEGTTYAGKIESSDRPVSPASTVADVANQVRALAPSPAATLSIDDERHKIFEVIRSESRPPQGRWQLIGGLPVVGLADGAIELVQLQPPGKTPMSGAAWGRGRDSDAGVIG